MATWNPAVFINSTLHRGVRNAASQLREAHMQHEILFPPDCTCFFCFYFKLYLLTFVPLEGVCVGVYFKQTHELMGEQWGIEMYSSPSHTLTGLYLIIAEGSIGVSLLKIVKA